MQIFTEGTSHGDFYEVIPGYADFLLKTGVSWVFVTGTTGESLSLTVNERISLFDAWMAQSEKGINVIAHVGAGITMFFYARLHAIIYIERV